MAQEREPLLQNGGGGNAKGSPALLPSLARSVLKFLMWAVFLTWAAGIFFYPTKPAQAALGQLKVVTKQSVFGTTGGVFLAFSAPILIVAALAYVYISAFPGDHLESTPLRRPDPALPPPPTSCRRRPPTRPSARLTPATARFMPAAGESRPPTSESSYRRWKSNLAVGFILSVAGIEINCRAEEDDATGGDAAGPDSTRTASWVMGSTCCASAAASVILPEPTRSKAAGHGGLGVGFSGSAMGVWWWDAREDLGLKGNLYVEPLPLQLNTS